MERRYSLYFIIALLMVLGLGAVAFKIFDLGFPILPKAHEQVWTVEASISFEANRKPVTVSLNLPDSDGRYTIVDEQVVSPGYGFRSEKKNQVSRGIWTHRSPKNKQKLYYRVQVFKRPSETDQKFDSIQPSEIEQPKWDEPYATAIETLIEKVRQRSADNISFTAELLRMINTQKVHENIALLEELMDTPAKQVALTVKLINTAGIPARVSRGIYLEDGRRGQKISGIVEVYDDKQWVAFDLITGSVGAPENFLYWTQGDQSLIEIQGGRNTEIRFATLNDLRTTQKVAVYLARKQEVALIDFSIYSLPVDTQNTFKVLLMIPLGAFVVVILRNLIGIRTSGTFMPILIAMAFMETSLFTGLILFLLVVSVGLMIRSYLSRLDLLLVPRISSVLVVVIILFVLISVLTHKLGIDAGLGITLFPMIIVSWTIERMSILWEEEGVHEVLIQGGGSLLTAVLAYLVMSNYTISHIIFNFPELLLVVLAFILMIGNYTGYRLTELRRFEPLGRE